MTSFSVAIIGQALHHVLKGQSVHDVVVPFDKVHAIKTADVTICLNGSQLILMGKQLDQHNRVFNFINGELGHDSGLYAAKLAIILKTAIRFLVETFELQSFAQIRPQ